MAKKISLLRSPGILLVALVVLVAATGLVYAHWTTTLRVDANVYTGGVYAEWLDTFTNDDGYPNADGELASNGLYDAWGDQSSLDPSAPGFSESLDDRYNKDVARCTSDIGGDTLNINVENAYPSYHCAVHGELGNKGSIPLRVTGIDANASFENRWGLWVNQDWDGQDPGPLYDGTVGWDDAGPFADENGNGVYDDPPEYRLYEDNRSGPMEFVPGDIQGNFELAFQGVPEIEGDIALGLNCGFQIDPMPCEWLFVEDDSPWDGHVDQCRTGDGPEDAACAYNEQDVFQGIVYESCGGPTYAADGWFHVLQEADQNTNYHWSLEQDFVNWNEFWAGMCTPGVPVVEGDGTETGQVACPNDYEGSGWTDPTGTPFDGMVYPDDFDSCLGG